MRKWILPILMIVVWPLLPYVHTSPLPSFPQGNPVTNGGFEILNDRGFPVDWEFVGDTVSVTPDAHSGKYALRFERGKGAGVPPEIGLNRAWRPHSGEGGKMLGQTKGGITFWYKVISAEPDAQMNLTVIPMSARPLEETGSPRAMLRIPNEYAGDGQWHEGKMVYDFSGNPKVKWVHVGVRLTAGAGVVIVDDIQYVERVGPLLQIEKMHLYPDPKNPGNAATFTACVVNIGDEPLGAGRVILITPEGLRATESPTLRPLAPNEAQTFKWQITGRLTPAALRIEAADARTSTVATFRLEPRVEIKSFLLKPGLAAPKGLFEALLTLQNRGTATAENIRARLMLTPDMESDGERIARSISPGKQITLRWTLKAPEKPGEYPLKFQISNLKFQNLPEGKKILSSQQPPEVSSARLTVTPALLQPSQPLTGMLYIRRGSDRTIGELRLPTRGSPLVARLPHLGQVITRLPDGGEQTLYARYRNARRQGKAVVLEAEERDRAGGLWTFTLTAQPTSPTSTAISIRVRCDKPRELLAFEGLILLAGEGSTGDAKSEAIFPGLEWVTADEVSSSDLDIAPNHPDRLRYVPHPHKVTIPAMGVKTPQAAVGLLWNVHQKWDGSNDRPQPVFAVPDRLKGHAAHRMGLMAPNVLTGLPENAQQAERGYSLTPGKSLTLSATLYADPGAKDALSVIEAWFKHYKPDPPLPSPQGNDVDQIAWSMNAYLDSLWVSAQEGWLPFQGGPGIWQNTAFRADYAYDLVMAIRFNPTHPDSSKWQARLAEVQSRIPAPQGDDMRFDYGDVLGSIASLIGRATGLMAAGTTEGCWVFDADRRDQGVFKGMDYHELGPDGAIELGTCARNAYEILLCARILGDEEAYRAGVKALEYMRRFTVPRAAQVWEVPVHTPDILAAADAVDAYLEAYRYSGDPKWLMEAKRWARAGLPFIYFWNAPDKPWMRYGSIPVFGATWFQGSWFGNLVQWNGLRYAYALLKLNTYDPNTRWGSLSWRDIAMGITRSAMYQQSTSGPNLALWPDSYHTITGVRAAWDFAPRQILKNVYTILGLPEEPETTKVSAPDGQIVRITTGGGILRARWENGVLSIRLHNSKSQVGQVLIAGITRPPSVHLQGQPLLEKRPAPGAKEGCWYYQDAEHLLLVWVPTQDEVSLVVEGVRPVPVAALPKPLKHLQFEFNDTIEGWVAANDLAPLQISEGALIAHATGGDPYLIRFACRIPADSVQQIKLRIRGSGDGEGQFFWTTAESPDFDEAKSVHFRFPTDGAWHEVSIPVGDHSLWRGQIITALRLDPGSTPNSVVEIDWIRMTTSTTLN